MKFFLTLIIALSLATQGFCAARFDHVEPAFWWTGMANPRLQILLHGKGIAAGQISLAPYPGVALEEVKTVLNPNYLFIYLRISPEAKPGKLAFTHMEAGKALPLFFELKARDASPKAQGYTGADVVYLIMPDRFANGNPANDNWAGMAEQANRKAPFGRHGGDLEGITKNLPYFSKLGVTTLWINPVQENDMPRSSYHGYAITDYYGVDRRFGGMPAYRSLIQKAHAGGLKIVMDMVMNHIGTNHYWVQDAPDSLWINRWPRYTPSNYRAMAVADPHGAKVDLEKMRRGWFDNTMADLNQEHPLLADYLIQNCIWWVEHTGIDAIRMDTYPYPDQPFMNRWSSEIMAQYPSFKLVGEVWVTQPGHAAYFTKSPNAFSGWKSTLPTVTDFPLRDAITSGLNEKEGFLSGMDKIHNVLAQDYLFEHPEDMLIFADNHDLTRMATAVKGDYDKNRQAMALLMTLRGVPQMYYGAEWFMQGDGAFHPAVRKDFPGGWAGDSANFFTGQGAGEPDQKTFAHTQKLLQWRKTATSVHSGKLMQFMPEDNVYVYFRYIPGQKRQTMVVINNNDTTKTLRLPRFAERLSGTTTAREVLTDQTLDLNQPWLLPRRAAYVVEVE